MPTSSSSRTCTPTTPTWPRCGGSSARARAWSSRTGRGSGWASAAFADVAELRAGEELQAGPVRVEATFAAHQGRRHPLGIHVAPVGFVVRGSRTVYFAGDTDLFAAMADLAGTIDVALLPVWGWGRSLGPGHLDPERAAQAAARIAPRVAIPIHWGTFSLPWPYPRPSDPQAPARAFATAVRPDRARGRRARAAAGRAGGAAVKRTLPVLRVLIVWVATALTLLLLSVLLSGFHVEDFGVALVASALIGLINAFVWPFVIRVALPLTVLTLGLGVIVLNGVVVLLVAELEPGLKVDNLGTGIVVALALTIVNTALTTAAGDRRRRLLVPQRGQAPGPARGPAGGHRRARAVLPRDRRARPRRARAGDARRQRTDAVALAARGHARAWRAGRPTGRRRPAPARPGCCTATTTTCPRSAGGRRSTARRS